MQKFFALYSTPRAEIDKFMQMPKDKMQQEIKEEMERWNTWIRDNAASIVDKGEIFGKTKRITQSGVSDVKNELTGYSIVQAKSHEEAVKLFEGHPGLRSPGSAVELMACLKMEGV